MPVYRERLGVPAWWWLIALLTAGLLGTLLWAGLSLVITVALYALGLAATVATLAGWGAAVIEVTAGELRAGRARLPLSQVGQVLALDRIQARALRGPQADPAAYLLIRPYLQEAVYVGVGGHPAQWPYLLLASRHPAALVAAIEHVRAPETGGAPCDDVGTGETAAAQPGALAAGAGEDPNVSKAP